MLRLRRRLKFDPPKQLPSPVRDVQRGTFFYYMRRRLMVEQQSARVPFEVGKDNFALRVSYHYDACYCLDRID